MFVHFHFFVEAIVKGKSLLLHTSMEVAPDGSRIQRMPSGHLVLTLPKVTTVEVGIGSTRAQRARELSEGGCTEEQSEAREADATSRRPGPPRI